MKTKYKIALLILSLVVLVAAAPALQQATRFRSLIVSDFINVAGPLTVGGAADFNSTVNFADATVSGLGEYFATDDSGNVTITGTLAVSDTGTFTSGLTSVGAAALNGGITADTDAFSVADTSGNTVIKGTLTTTGATTLNGGLTMDTDALTVADTSGNTQIKGTLGVTGATTLTGDTDVAGTLQYGADNLYPLGYASVNQQVVCGRTSTFTASTTVSVTGLSTVTYVLPVQVTAPITTATYLYHSIPTTTTFDLTSLNNGYGAGTTGVVAEWCAVGDQ